MRARPPHDSRGQPSKPAPAAVGADILAPAQMTCLIRRALARRSGGTKGTASKTSFWGESDGCVRSAALSARARQLTPQAGERGNARLRLSGTVPARRRWRLTTMPVAVTVASLSVCAGGASAGGGGVTPPDPPQLKDVICISTCGGLRKATTKSKVQLSGRHLSEVIM